MTRGGKRPGAGRPRKPKRERRTRVLRIRLTDAEYEGLLLRFRNRVDATVNSISTYARRLLVG